MVARLAAEGRLGLDQPLAELLPGVPVAAAGEITVRHLLSHGSGIDGDVSTDTGPGSDCVEREHADDPGRATSSGRLPDGRRYHFGGRVTPEAG